MSSPAQQVLDYLDRRPHPGDVLFRDLAHGLALEVARGWCLDPRDAADVFDGMRRDEDRWSVMCCAESRLTIQRRYGVSR